MWIEREHLCLLPFVRIRLFAGTTCSMRAVVRVGSLLIGVLP